MLLAVEQLDPLVWQRLRNQLLYAIHGSPLPLLAQAGEALSFLVAIATMDFDRTKLNVRSIAFQLILTANPEFRLGQTHASEKGS